MASSPPPSGGATSSSPRRSNTEVTSPLSYPVAASSPSQHTPANSGGPGASSSPLPYTPGSVASRASNVSMMASPRRDLGGARHLREFDPTSNSATGNRGETSTSGGEGAGQPRAVIWGTDVSVDETSRAFKHFLLEFSDAPGAVPKYLRLIEHMDDTDEWFLHLDCADLRAFDMSLYDRLVRYPTEVIPTFDHCIEEVFRTKFGEPRSSPQTRPFNLTTSTAMRDLNPEDVDQLVSVCGMVIRISSVIPEPRVAFFSCSACNHTVTAEVDRGIITEPSICPGCNGQKTYEVVHNRCLFSDKQMIKLQETPDKVPDGQTPQTALIYSFDSLVDAVQPGDLVEVTAIYKATPLRINPRHRTVKSVFKTHLDVLHFQQHARNRIGRADITDDVNEDPKETEARDAKLKALSQQPDIVDRLVKAIAPSIYGFEEVKKGVLAMLFGGTHKRFAERARGRFRGEINILLCGDPGTSKSQLLQYAVKLAPRGMYTSGKGSSAVGLTAYVTKDPETRQIVLESGALVLCDGGVCCIDEFDKMSDATRAILHEVMEQQTVSIAKAGIIASLNARTSILAAANPQDSSWNERMSIVDNIQLPPTLLSRFDLIYLILDKPAEVKDKQLARHIVSLYYENRQTQGPGENDIDRDTLAQYISYARKNINPVITEEASRNLISGYVTMRKSGNQRKTVSATPRQLESLIRLAEAHARMRFSEEVTARDVEDSIDLMRTALQQAATDPKTGQIDLDLINTGQSRTARHKSSDLAKEVQNLLIERNMKQVSFSALLKLMTDRADINVSVEELRTALQQLETDEFIKIVGNRRSLEFTIKVIAALGGAE